MHGHAKSCRTPPKIEWVPFFGYRLTNGDERWFDTYLAALNATRN
jgi:hypothetical protein